MRHTITRQGHIYPESVHVMNRKPGFMRLYIETEQKRPAGYAHAWDGDLLVMLMARDPASEGQTLRLRDGDDGSAWTLMEVRLPRVMPWNEWEAFAEPDKWGLEVLLFTNRKVRYFTWRQRVRAWLRRS